MEVRPPRAGDLYDPVEKLRRKCEREAAIACSMLMAASEAIAGVP